LFHKEQVTVTSVDNPNASFTFNELSLSLIENHHFFQGKGSPHRLEPAVLKTTLQM
jgi:hypothetical protein